MNKTNSTYETLKSLVIQFPENFYYKDQFAEFKFFIEYSLKHGYFIKENNEICRLDEFPSKDKQIYNLNKRIIGEKIHIDNWTKIIDKTPKINRYDAVYLDLIHRSRENIKTLEGFIEIIEHPEKYIEKLFEFVK